MTSKQLEVIEMLSQISRISGQLARNLAILGARQDAAEERRSGCFRPKMEKHSFAKEVFHGGAVRN